MELTDFVQEEILLLTNDTAYVSFILQIVLQVQVQILLLDIYIIGISSCVLSGPMINLFLKVHCLNVSLTKITDMWEIIRMKNHSNPC